MREIPVKENVTVKLKNVLMRRTDQFSADEFQRITQLFDTYVKTIGVEAFGPPITKTQTSVNGTIETTFIRQLKGEPEKVTEPYEFSPELRLENCILAQYEGPENEMTVVHSKLGVYAYEHEIKLDGEVYTVLKEAKEGSVKADVFVGTIR